jgi:DNA primase
MSSDPIIDAFVHNYGIKNLLDDLDVKKIQSTGKSQLVGCCPFHDENNPSFSMNTESGLWKCFGCGIVGNLFQFVSLSYNIDYSAARKFILERAGLDEATNLDDIIFSRKLDLAVTDVAQDEEVIFTKFTQKQIESFYETPEPFDYLKNRGFTEETIKYFECGYTSKWRSFNRETKAYENQPRIIIPGHDEYGNYAGFIGRTPVGDEPKYKYTYGYPKSHTLFNLHRARKHADDGLILVEGSTDAMNIHQIGKPNVCAILGASLSKAQVKLLSKYTDTVYLMFDNDSAGQTATKGAVEMLHSIMKNLSIVPLNGIKDPGEITSSAQLEKYFKNAINWFEFQMKEVNAQWQ